MAKVTFSTDIQSISGKLCSKEGVTYSVNQQTGKTYRSDRHGYSDPKTAVQQTIRAIFKEEVAVSLRFVEAEPSVRQVSQGYGGLPRRDEGVQGAAQDWQPIQLHALPRHRRPQGRARWQRPHGWRIGSWRWSEAWWRAGDLKVAKRKKALTFSTVGTRLAVFFLFFGQEHHTDTNLCATMRAEGSGVDGVLCLLLCIFFFLLFFFFGKR